VHSTSLDPVTVPSRTFTFLLTDIEGSTRLWEDVPQEMRSALARHDQILRRVTDLHGGTIFSSSGDSFAVAFREAPSAIHAAVEAQRLLRGSTDPEIPELRERMGIHTGAAQERDDNFFGPALNRCARLMSVAHGGQILCSDSTAVLCRENLSPEIRLVDLGDHRLRDLAQPVHAYQLTHPAFDSLFPPLQSLDSFPTNLPAQLTVFVGRDAELGAVEKYLLEGRLLTLTGVGGVGKTRVAL
jgi:class 3 adenylate cyclase